MTGRGVAISNASSQVALILYMHNDQLPRVQNFTQVPDDSTANKLQYPYS